MGNSFGLLGRHLGHSWSPAIHARLAGYDYGLCELEPGAVADFLAATDLAGMNVTIPYKKTVMPFCVSLSPAARAVGSVNTLVRTPEGWHGDNTDYAGFLALARSLNVPLAGKKAVVLGTGGASLAVAAALKDLDAEPIVRISRHGPDNYENLANHADARILVNATPVGMYPSTEASPVDLEAFPRLEAVLDLIYNPLRTRLLLEAEARGIPRANGLRMLVAQARGSAEQFAKTSIPDGQVETITRDLTRQMENIVLIGMPGCGKSTVGAILAERLGRELLDADDEIVRRTGMSIPDIFAAEGEPGFRRRETEVLADLGKRSGAIIATGGGCVTREENYPLLRQNGVLVWLRRNVNALPTEGRPLSQRTSPAALYEARKPLYERFADIQIENDTTAEHAADAILEALP